MLHIILLLTVVVAEISEIEAVSKSACSGGSAQIFKNMSFTINDAVVSLYVNASKSTLIAMWSKGQIIRDDAKVSLDEYGNIWIHNITMSDETQYKVLHSINGSIRGLYDAQLTVLVAPAKSCRPQLKREGNTLIASLEAGADCGKPEAVPYWLEYPDVNYDLKTKAQLSPGREAGTYYACIETPALSCARSSKPSDFCSSFTVDESSNQKPLTDSTCIFAIAGLGVAVLVIVVVVITLFLCRKRIGFTCLEQNKPYTKDSGQLDSMEESDPMTNAVESQRNGKRNDSYQ